jgi:hypothetical protein
MQYKRTIELGSRDDLMLSVELAADEPIPQSLCLLGFQRRLHPFKDVWMYVCGQAHALVKFL